MNKPIIITPSAFEQIMELEEQVYTQMPACEGVLPFAQIMSILRECAGEVEVNADKDLEQAKHLITGFLINEYQEDPDSIRFDDITEIGLAYTEFGENGQYPVQVTANLEDCTVAYTILSDQDGICRSVKTENYKNLRDMNRSFLNHLSFDDLVSEFAEELEVD